MAQDSHALLCDSVGDIEVEACQEQQDRASPHVSLGHFGKSISLRLAFRNQEHSWVSSDDRREHSRGGIVSAIWIVLFLSETS